MSQAPDDHDDDRTWQQPLLGHGSGRLHDQATAPESPREDAEAHTAPQLTSLERTSPPAEVSQVPEGPSGDNSRDSDPARTEVQGEGSSEWDQLPPPVFEPGRVVFDKYRLLEKIGEGGMGEVWRVWHVDLETERALKLIKPDLAYNTKGWLRFQREARLMAQINHPNAVSVYDFRRARSVGYIEMEYIRGRSLTEVLNDSRDQLMPLDQVAQILNQLCSVLQEAHNHVDESTGKPKPIIHRDLKPSNLMLVDRKDATGPLRLKVLDFGIAKIAEDEGSPELTGAGDLVGTPAYMSPEQIRGGVDLDGSQRPIDVRSDLYSTGVVLYHLLTGSIPFRGSKMALLAAHLNNPPMPMKEANPRAEVPPAVERVVMQCLEKDPVRRPQSARQLADQFLQAAGLGASAPQTSSGDGARFRRTIAVTAVAVLLASIGLGAVIVARKGIRRVGPVPESASVTDPGSSASVSDPGSTVRKPENPVASGGARRLRLWEPEGYAAVDPNEIVPDHPGFPVRLQRLDRKTVPFVFLREYVYLPEGYKPESDDDTVGEGWPAVIIRTHDGVRFVRIPGAVYLRGDPSDGPPELDFENKPITPHYVRVGGFYIQETEVTNGEIEGYVKDHPGDLQGDLQHWSKWYAAFTREYRIPPRDAARYPAACVDYTAARKYALSVGGLLPTEAQWEWVAKSCTESFRFAWDEHPPQAGERARARLDDDIGSFSPAPVKQYPRDQTSRHVFDMIGNMREICADAYVPYSDLNLAGNTPANPLKDRRGVVDLSLPRMRVVVRGGSFRTPEDRATAFYRSVAPPGNIPGDVGFRVVIECPERAETAP